MTDRLVTHFRAMARNNAWANARLLEAVEALGPDGFAAARTSFFPSLRATLNHSHAVDQYYIDALEQAGIGRAAYRNAPDFAEPAALRAAQAACDARLVAFCDRLTGPDLDRSVPTDRGPVTIPERVDALLAHLFQHQIHHRGQAHAMLAGTSVPPPQLDEFFLDFDRHPSAAAAGLMP
ncbi:DinB family protein [soil metagenome]